MKYLLPHLVRQQNIIFIGAKINEELMVELHTSFLNIDIKLYHRRSISRNEWNIIRSYKHRLCENFMSWREKREKKWEKEGRLEKNTHLRRSG